jgi:hypothetical protein
MKISADCIMSENKLYLVKLVEFIQLLGDRKGNLWHGQLQSDYRILNN